MCDEKIIAEVIRLVDEGVSVTLPVKGNSMLPFIVGGKESVILQNPVKPGKGVVVLANIDRRRHVLHRIIRIDGKRITLMGDGNIDGTEHCMLSDIKAIATHVVKEDGTKHYLYDRKRRWASRMWYWLRPARRYLLAIYNRL